MELTTIIEEAMMIMIELELEEEEEGLEVTEEIVVESDDK